MLPTMQNHAGSLINHATNAHYPLGGDMNGIFKSFTTFILHTQKGQGISRQPITNLLTATLRV